MHNNFWRDEHYVAADARPDFVCKKGITNYVSKVHKENWRF